jgi:DNA-binding response OmpR family regulator
MITPTSAQGLLDMAADVGLTLTELRVVSTMLSEDRWWQLWEIGLNISERATVNAAKVHVCHIRRKFRAFAERNTRTPRNPINSKYGFGYRIDRDVRARLLNWPAEQSAAA